MNINEYMSLKNEDKLEYFLSTLSSSNKTADYFVNWDKVTKNSRDFEIELNTLNYLIGKDDIETEARALFISQPNLLRAIPSLLAIRDDNVDLIYFDKNDEINEYNLDFENIDIKNIDSYIRFCKQSGIFYFLSKLAKKSLVDYVYGVEAGLDSNARKNRGGKVMEDIIEKRVAAICRELGYSHFRQVNADFIYSNWGLEVAVDKSKRRFDEAVFDPFNNRLWLIETNFYGGGGSKLKSVCGEFTNLRQILINSKSEVDFIRITDGKGRLSTKVPLSEAFEHIPNIFNLKMLENNFLKNLIQS